MITIRLTVKKKEREIVEFLSDVQDILSDENFDESKLLLNIKEKPDDIEHSTPYTLLDLDYDASDVIDTIRRLSIYDYSEALLDKDNQDTLCLYVFGKEINGKLIYIKLKIKETPQRRVLCVSFHYAKHEMDFAFRK